MKSMRYLWAGLISAVVLCFSAFAWLTGYLAEQNEHAVEDLSAICMEQMATQIQLHFESTIDLQQARLESVLCCVPENVPQDSDSDGEDEDETTPVPASTAPIMSADEAAAKLSDCASSLGFSYLALYSSDGTCQTLLGEPTELEDKDSFLAAIAQGTSLTTEGTSTGETPLVALGAAAHYPMQNGMQSATIVAALPVDVFCQDLSLDISETKIYSHIVRSDGTFVLCGENVSEATYFDRILNNVISQNGNASETLSKVREAIAAEEPCSFTIEIAADNEMRSVCLLPLPRTEWFLAANLPQSLLGDPLSTLTKSRSFSMLLSCGIVLTAVIVLFALYFQLMRKQTIAIDEARREAEIARREAETANRAKSSFLSSMSHDIRTPLNAIMGLAAVASQSPDDKAVVRNSLQKITLSSKLLLGLINNVLDMSKIESGKLTLHAERVSLRKTIKHIQDIMKPQAESKNIELCVTEKNIIAENILCDQVRLDQVLLNLVSNALKFTPEKGSVVLGVSQRFSPRGASWVTTEFSVKDNGIGMSPEFMDRIFESFEREDTNRVHKTEGSGLGMSIAKGIVDSMGGTIHIRSIEGEGSEFLVVVDFERAPEAKAAEGANASDGSEKSSGSEGVEKAENARNAAQGSSETTENESVKENRAGENTQCEHRRGNHGKQSENGQYGQSKTQAQTTAQTEVQTQEEIQTQLEGKRILLAEDNELNWEVAAALLKPYKLELTWAKDGQECIDIFEASDVGFFDAILMDVQMPNMDGYAATRAIRALARTDAHIPIVAMTADVFTEDVVRSKKSGMSAHVPKPIDPDSLAKTLFELLAKRS